MKAEEEDVTFVCRAGGKPKPKVEWSINGVPIEGMLLWHKRWIVRIVNVELWSQRGLESGYELGSSLECCYL